jgi:type II secretory pathway pseudopilin PulG
MRAKRPDGFTLIELVVLCAVVVTLSALAVPRYGRAMVIYRADNAARVLTEDLRLAGARAAAQAQPVTVTFDTSAHQYRMAGVADPDDRSEDFLRDLAADPYQARLARALFAGDNEVIFNGFGLPDSGGSVEIHAGNEVRTVTLEASTGEAEVQ